MKLEAGGLVLLMGAVFWWWRIQFKKDGCDKTNGDINGSSAISQSTKLDTKFDVFLNHRGPDTKMTFGKILHNTLHRVGCQPFLDVDSLVKGEKAFSSINDALSGAFVHVAILSPRYAESRYCLDELCDMLSSKKPIIVVFYNVEPENLRRTSEGPYARAFEKHLKRGLNENVKRWKNALIEVATITGFKHRDLNDDIVKLTEEVVARILSVLPPPLGSPFSQHRVGVSESLNFVLQKLHAMGEYPGAIGIYGMGGIGKTTLASELYYRERTSFDHHCFLKDVKEYEGKAMENLQMDMVSRLLHVDLEILQDRQEHFFLMIKKKKVFLVIDDVRDVKQFHELLPNLEDLMPGSRVVITSRDCSMLRRIMRDLPQLQQLLYPMPELNFQKSLELFIWHVFRKTSLHEIDDVLHHHVEDIVRACKGVPLAIEVMGGYMWDKREELEWWPRAKLVLKSNDDIMSNLKFSYDGLKTNKLKRMFLDIACCMVGHPKYVALEVWKSIGYVEPEDELSTLVNKCMIKIDNMGLLNIHDLLRDMGHNIVIDESIPTLQRPSYVWNSLEGVRTLQSRQGEGVIALSLIGVQPSTILKANLFESFKELRYLFLGGCVWQGEFSSWSSNLRWLQWRHFPYNQLPKHLQLPSLVVLDLSESNALTKILTTESMHENPLTELRILLLKNCIEIKTVPNGIQCCRNLKRMDFEGCLSLTSLPNVLTKLSDLEIFNLSGCKRLRELPNIFNMNKLKVLNLSETSLSELPQNFYHLRGLKELYFKRCRNLVHLPKSFGCLANLEELFMGDCEKFQRLPSSFGDLKKLWFLDLSNTAIRDIPDNFGHLSSLKQLNLRNCKNLVKLPESFGCLANLEELFMGYCEEFERLPSSFGDLKKLWALDLSNTTIRDIPDNFGHLSSLKQLGFTNCKNLVELPESFGCLANLEELFMKDCEKFQRLPSSFGDLKKLWFLDLSNTSIRDIPKNFGHLSSLKNVKFKNCKNLVKLPKSFGCLANLKFLNMRDCKEFQKLPSSFGDLKKLCVLHLCNTAIQDIPENFGHLSSLKKMKFENCKNLVKLPESFGCFANLKELFMGDCEEFERLPSSFGDLKKLWILEFSNTAIRDIPENFGHLSSLKLLYFRNCKNLVELPESFGCLANLEELLMGDCEEFERLPSSFGDLKKLWVLDLSNTTIRDIPENFGHLSSLKLLYFMNCKNLVELPESFGCLANLEELFMGDCEEFERLPSSFGDLKKLWFLDLSNTAIRDIPKNFGHLSSLKNVKFKNCKNLVELSESFGCLANLEELFMGDCEEFERLPSSFGDLKKLWFLDLSNTSIRDIPKNFGHLSSLKNVKFKNCKNLVELSESFGCLANLEELLMGDCEEFERLPSSFGDLKKLWVLDLSNTTIRDIPENFGHLSSLKQLGFTSCKNLVKLPESFGCLANLEELFMGDCEEFERLPSSFGDLKKLWILEFSNTAIRDVPENFVHLSSLKQLYFRNCKNLVKLPESFGCLANLEELLMGDCKEFERLPSSFGDLKKLWVLEFSNTAIRDIPENFGYLSSLKQLYFKNCKNLVKLPESFGCLANLEKLLMGDCEEFERLHLLLVILRSFGSLILVIQRYGIFRRILAIFQV